MSRTARTVSAVTLEVRVVGGRRVLLQGVEDQRGPLVDQEFR
jgi:hypothetical protein